MGPIIILTLFENKKKKQKKKKKKNDGDIVHPSVCPSCYLLLNS